MKEKQYYLLKTPALNAHRARPRSRTEPRHWLPTISLEPVWVGSIPSDSKSCD